MTAETRARALFRDIYEADPTVVVRAPGRVNLLGAHIDYSEGWVITAAIDPTTDRNGLIDIFCSQGATIMTAHSLDSVWFGWQAPEGLD